MAEFCLFAQLERPPGRESEKLALGHLGRCVGGG